MKNKARKAKHEPEEDDERFRGFLRDRFPEGLPPSQSPKDEYPEDVKDRKPRRGKSKSTCEQPTVCTQGEIRYGSVRKFEHPNFG